MIASNLLRQIHPKLALTVLLILFLRHAQAQCEHPYTLEQVYPWGLMCSPQNVTLRATYTYDPMSFGFEGEFRWYSSQYGGSPLSAGYVVSPTSMSHDYTFWFTESTVIWVSYYDQWSACETARQPIGVGMFENAEIYQNMARACGDGNATVQLSSNQPNVTFDIFKYLPESSSYQHLLSNTTGQFTITNFDAPNYDQYYATVTREGNPGCMPAYFHLNIDVQTMDPPVVPANTGVCFGSATTLTAAGGDSYKWYQNGNLISTSPQLNIPGTLSVGTYQYQVERISNSGCVSNRANPTVTVYARPVDGTIGASATTICLGQSVTISSSGGVGTPYYWASTNEGSSWNVFAQAYGGQTSFSYTPTAAGTYRFHLRNATQCGFCWDAGNQCTTYPYVDVVVQTPSNGGVTYSVNTGQSANTVLTNTFGATTLTGAIGTVQEWQYAFANNEASYVSWGQAGLTTTTGTCCINVPGNTIWIRAKVKNGVCATVNSPPTSYYWQPTLPVANAGSDKTVTLSTSSIAFPGTASGGNSTLSYLWTQVSGPSTLNLSGSTTLNLVVSGYTQPGNYTLRLRATDTYNQQHTDDAILTVQRTTLITNAGSDVNTVLSSTPSTLNGSATGGDGTKTYQWTQVAGPATLSISGANTTTLSVSGYTLTGAYTFRLTTTDAFGQQHSDDAVLNVGRTSMVANAGVDKTTTVATPSVSFIGSATGGDGTKTYQWSQILGPSLTLTNASTSTLTVSGYAPNVTYRFRLTVTDAFTQQSTDDVDLFVQSTPPVVYAGPDIDTHDEALSAALNGSVSQGNGSIVSYQWTQLTGTAVTVQNATTLNATVTGFGLGTYTFRLTATDQFGYSGSDEMLMTVIHANNFNYVRETTLQQEGIVESQIPALSVNQKAVITTYYDGLGRPIQTVSWKNTSLLNDMIQPVKYDPYNREADKFLPYTDTGEQNGWYRPDALKDPASNETDEVLLYQSGKQYQFYQTGANIEHDVKPYARSMFEPSPLNRVVKQGSPGAAWQPNMTPEDYSDRVIKKEYLFNEVDDVVRWTYDPATGTISSGSASTREYYEAKQLRANKTYDEHNNLTIEYTDKDGQVVLKRVHVTGPQTPNDVNFASTYYIYNDLGQLVVVLPPEGVKELLGQ